jgi:enamine deaminase RidA (YjgF/YER057c/UK114 family)
VTYSVIVTRIALNLREKLDDVASQIEASLDEIDQRYRNMSRILKMNLYLDDPIAKQFVNETRATHNSLIKIAKKITDGFDTEDKEEAEDTDGRQ